MFEGAVFKKKKGTKKMTIRLASSGEFLVTFPYRIPLFLAKAFFLKNKKRAEDLKNKKEVSVESLKKTYNLKSELFLHHEGEALREYKREALALATTLVSQTPVSFQVEYQKITIKNTKTRWGSCSSSGALSFHYKILFLPPNLAEYLIIHELCHLKEMNHSSRFWLLVSLACPSYQEKRKLLRSLSLA